MYFVIIIKFNKRAARVSRLFLSYDYGYTLGFERSKVIKRDLEEIWSQTVLKYKHLRALR